MHPSNITLFSRTVAVAVASILGVFVAASTAMAAEPTLSTRSDGKTVAIFSEVGTGTWTVPDGVASVEVLMVGGGGGGAGFVGGGGGAGGLIYLGSQVVSGTIDITIGAGGAGGANAMGNISSRGFSGSDTVFGSLTALGGGGGGAYGNIAGLNGGSGGGCGSGTGVAGLSIQLSQQGIGVGFKGGDSNAGGNYAGGGGAGGAGSNFAAGNGGLGGLGLQSEITGVPLYYAGGGGGGQNGASLGGSGVGGNGYAGWGGTLPASCNGAANTGSGGGGGAGTNGGAGSNGIVIVAYQVSSKTLTTTELVSSDANSEDGQSVTFTATVKDGGVTATGATGTYEFKIDGAVVAAAADITGGVATYSSNSLTTGAHTVTATYSGDETYEWSTASITQTNVTPKMLTFSFGTLGAATISGTDISITVPHGTIVTSLAPAYTHAAGATGNPASNSTQDFTSSVPYTLTSDVDPLVAKVYNVTVTVEPFAVYTTREDGYTVATFKEGSGTWTALAGVTSVELLMVGGGGGGGGYVGGGGGAGGLIYLGTQAVSGTLDITIGAGGAGGADNRAGGDTAGVNGGDTLFGSLTAVGGGGGGGIARAGKDGGSGGGCGGGAGGTASGLSIQFSQQGIGVGYDGGSNGTSNYGGGGGAGSAGYKNAGDGGNGGDGQASSITGIELFYAGGGGACFSTGGSGVGGNGGASWGGQVGGNAVANTGSGGGGASLAAGGVGGSGVVIIAYEVPATPYDGWAGPDGYNLAGGLDADDDGDSLSNFHEFAFGLNPTTGSSVNPITDTSALQSGQFSYTRWDTSGLSYTVWTSLDLKTWTKDGTASQVDGALMDGVRTVNVTLTDPPPSGDKRFVRVAAD